ncbi:hypothetical protein, partial [Enterobacter sichuanensis]
MFKFIFGKNTYIKTKRAREDGLLLQMAVVAGVAGATTVGQLTSSIAHEINQPLMSIVSNA